MARLVSLSTISANPVAKMPVSRLPRPVPIQSGSSRTTTLNVASVASRRLPVPSVQASSRTTLSVASMPTRQQLPTLLSVSSKTTERTSRIPLARKVPVASSRTKPGAGRAALRHGMDTTSRMKANRLQIIDAKKSRPTTTAVQKAKVTNCSDTQTRASDINAAPSDHNLSKTLIYAETTAEANLEASDHRDSIDSLLAEDNPLSRIDRNIQLLGVFREGGRIAPCPAYIGPTIVKPRVRPLQTTSTDLQALQHENKDAHIQHRSSPIVSKLPRAVRPPVKPKDATPSVAQVTPKTVSSAKSKSVQKVSLAGGKKKIPNTYSIKNRATSLKKLSRTTKPLRTGKSNRRLSNRRLSLLRKRTILQHSSGVAAPSGPRKTLSGSTAPKSDIIKLPTSETPKSNLRQPGTKQKSEYVQFVEGPTTPRFYQCEAPPKDSSIDLNEDWAPLKLSKQYPSSSQAEGMTMFKPTNLGTLTLSPLTARRYKSVQEYERRRREETLANGGQPELGQLEYGNADYKIALQATNVITSYDIGTMQSSSAIGTIGVPRSTYHLTETPFLVFGAFKEPFTDTIVPAKTAKAYKAPLRWPATASEAPWKKFDKKHLRSLQHADLED